MDVAEHLQTIFTEYYPNTFVGDWPATVPNCVAIRLWDGSNTQYFGGTTVFTPLVLFLVRSETYVEGRGVSEVAVALFHQYSDALIKHMTVGGNIIHLGKNPEGLHEFQVGFKTILRE